MSKKKIPDDATLSELYLDQRMSSGEIAEEYGMARASVCRHLRRIGIVRPEEGENSRNRNFKVKQFRNGYPVTFIPNHPRANNLGYVFDHVRAWETKWGYLPKRGEPVHHIDLDRSNSDINNLYMFANHKQHQEAHKSLDDCARELIKKGIIGFSAGRYFLR